MSVNNCRRYNPLLDEWVIVASNRVSRPWQGAKTEQPSMQFQNSSVVNPLAPGGVRAEGKVTPQYDSVYVFENDFPSFTRFPPSSTTASNDNADDDLFRQQEIRGECRVICYNPNSEKSIAQMNDDEAFAVVRLWMEQFVELARSWTWVQIFENRGAAVGSSNGHPHGQIWAGDFLPNLPLRKDNNQKAYFEKHGSPLLVDYLAKEVAKNERIVLANDHWIVLVPFWALWPYETMILPRKHVQRLSELDDKEQRSLSTILRLLMIKYDNIFQCSFPLVMGWLGAPTGPNYSDQQYAHWQLHCIVHPPLLRSATVPKFMAGYEILAEPQRDITPELAASTIRGQEEVHYSTKGVASALEN